MIGMVKDTTKVAELFRGWQEPLIWSCLQRIMGAVYARGTGVEQKMPQRIDCGDIAGTTVVCGDMDMPKSAMALIGDFCFFAGAPDLELVKYVPEGYAGRFLIMVPQSEEWAGLIEECYREHAKRVTRFATKKDQNHFDRGKLRSLAGKLPVGYQLRMIDESAYRDCRVNGWAGDLVSLYPDYQTYKRLGIGAVIEKDGELVAGASAYARYREGIEIEIDTRLDHRRKGLALACGARLILECLEAGLYPSWDAQNSGSLALAEKLGYCFDYEYPAYEVTRGRPVS